MDSDYFLNHNTLKLSPNWAWRNWYPKVRIEQIQKPSEETRSKKFWGDSLGSEIHFSDKVEHIERLITIWKVTETVIREKHIRTVIICSYELCNSKKTPQKICMGSSRLYWNQMLLQLSELKVQRCEFSSHKHNNGCGEIRLQLRIVKHEKG